MPPLKPRSEPTPEDLQDLRRLINKAGGKAGILRWIEQVLATPPRRRGRKPGTVTHNRDDALLALISTRLRIGVTPHVAARSLVEALKSIIDRDSSPELWRCMAATEDSVIRRLTRKLKTGSFDENRQKKKSSLRPRMMLSLINYGRARHDERQHLPQRADRAGGSQRRIRHLSGRRSYRLGRGRVQRSETSISSASRFWKRPGRS